MLITSLKDHQSALTVEERVETPDGDGALLPRFLTVMDRPDDPAGRVQAGNEWVVEARLADARFFYQEDRKRPLAERAGELEQLAFHAALGSYAEKTGRLEELAAGLCDELGWDEERESARRAAGLLKIDLVTEMVKEFTSLQGVIGGVYLREDGEPEEVWQAVYDQYLPTSTDDPLPRGRAGAVVAVADRFDSLVGMFGLGLVPTGSRDPFGLRRAAQGAARIALERDLPLDFGRVLERAAALYGDRLETSAEEIRETPRAVLRRPGAPPAGASRLRLRRDRSGHLGQEWRRRDRRRAARRLRRPARSRRPGRGAPPGARRAPVPVGGARRQADRQHRQGRRAGGRRTRRCSRSRRRRSSSPPSASSPRTSRRRPPPGATRTPSGGSPSWPRSSTGSSRTSW